VTNYWPWWAGALGLALVTINYTVATDRSFGVSSAWDRVLHWRTERRVEEMKAQLADRDALAEALAAATAERFGSSSGVIDPPPGHVIEPTTDGRSDFRYWRPPPLASQAALLLSILIGGWVAAVTSGRFQVRLDMGDGFRHLVTGSPLHMVGVLFAGGVLVGFGTRLAGGCSSGHGLSGCGRLQPVSLLATATFFGAAVLVSFLLWRVI
jgi:hypothetical protein